MWTEAVGNAGEGKSCSTWRDSDSLYYKFIQREHLLLQV